ncbi:MAG: transposase, partial [Bryobacteraceae bacterium]
MSCYCDGEVYYCEKCRVTYTRALFALYPDEESARVYLEGRIWPSGPVCPSCAS